METLRRAKAGDVEAIETVMISHKPLVRERIAHLYILGADYEDTLQEGMIGLYKAILTYDPARGASFATYASTCVRNHVIDQVKKPGERRTVRSTFPCRCKTSTEIKKPPSDPVSWRSLTMRRMCLNV